MSRLTRLDAVRGIACLAVVTEHALQAANVNVGMRFTPIFFMLSGFLLYRPVVRGKFNYDRRWFEKRAVRLIPAFWVTLYVAGHFGPFGTAPSLTDLIGGTGSSIPQSWSLGVEFTFYASLPIIVWLSQKTRYPHVIAIGVVATTAIASFATIGWGPSLLNHTGFIAMGMLVAVAYERNQMVKLPVAPIVGYLTVIAYFTSGEIEGNFAPFFLGAALGLTLLSAALVGNSRVLDSKYLKQVGTVSFGVYLWHLHAIWLPLDNYWAHPPVEWTLLFGLLGGLIAGHISYYAIERPLVRLRQLYTSRKETSCSPSSIVPPRCLSLQSR